ncbi:UNVERIFIED_CONTAM: hypothetical protein FKN15_033327 [Acipenser sinensis]
MSQATKRKHVVKEVLGDYVIPTEPQRIVRGREAAQIKTYLLIFVFLPPSFSFIRHSEVEKADCCLEEEEGAGSEEKGAGHSEVEKADCCLEEEEGAGSEEKGAGSEEEGAGSEDSESEPDDSDLFVNTNRVDYEYTYSEEEEEEEEEEEGSADRKG